MIERTHLSFPPQLQKDVRLLIKNVEGHYHKFENRNLVMWHHGEIGISHRGFSHANEDNRFGDVDTCGSRGSGDCIYGNRTTDWKICKCAQGTEVEKAYATMQRLNNDPNHRCRARIIRVEPGHAQRLRTERCFVYHIAIDTNPQAFFMITTGDDMPKRMREGNLPTVRTYNIAEDGHAYILDGTKYHGIMNAGETTVVHLVVETDRVPGVKPKWTGQTAERMTGNQNVLEERLPESQMFHSEF